MNRFLFWLRKYFVILLAFGLAIGAVLMSIDFKSIIKVDAVIEEGDGENAKIATREEFDALTYSTVNPLLKKALGEETDIEPTHQSIAIYYSDISEEVVGDDGIYGNYEESFVLAIVDNAIYLRCRGIENEGDPSDGWSEYICMDLEYYFIGGEVYTRIVQYDYIDGGHECTAEDFRAGALNKNYTFSSDMPTDAYIQMVRGDLYKKWVRITEMGMAELAKNELDSAWYCIVNISENGTFYEGTEPQIIYEWAMITRMGETAHFLEGHSDDTDAHNITETMQFKYINNTVIDDITNEHVYDIRDYM